MKQTITVSTETFDTIIEELKKHWFDDTGEFNNDSTINLTKRLEYIRKNRDRTRLL